MSASHPNLNQLRVFHAVASAGSFTRAAATLHLTQPGVSKHVRHLEREYGTALFERGGRAVELTPAGRLLYQATQEVTACLERAGRQVRELARAAPTVVIAATFTAGLHVLPARLARFKGKNPQVATTLTIYHAAEVEARVLDRAADVGVIGHEIRDRRLTATEFFSEPLAVVVPAAHRWAARARPVRPAELLDEPFVATAPGSGTRIVVEDRLRKNGVRLARAIDLGNMEGVKKGVEAGLGVSILSESVVRREAAAGLLAVLPLAGKDMVRRFRVVRRKGGAVSDPVGLFVAALRDAPIT